MNPAHNNPRIGLLARLRNYLLAGLVVTAPTAITLYLTWLFVDVIDRVVKSVLPPVYNPDTYLPFSVPGLGLVIVVALLILIGFGAASFAGRLLVRFSEWVLARMPVVSSIYGAIKQILETIFAAQTEAFRQVVMLEYPRRGTWSIGFVTSTTQGEVQTVTSEEVVNVFVPTTPNPTSGFLLFVPRKDLYVLDMSIEDGVKLVVSGGIVTPPGPKTGKARVTDRIKPTAGPGMAPADKQPKPIQTSPSVENAPPHPAQTDKADT